MQEKGVPIVPQVGQSWRRKNGVVYKVAETKIEDDLEYCLLVPVSMPSGVKARSTWKYSPHVAFDLELVDDTMDTSERQVCT